MKKLLILFLFCFFLNPTLTFSQAKIGFYVGSNLSKLSGDMPKDAKYRNLVGAIAGTHLDIKVGSLTSLNIGFSYLQQGTKVFYKVPKVEELVDSLQLRLNYFSIPISFKVNSTKERFYAIAGLEAAYLLNTKLKSKDIEQEVDFDISDFNMSIYFGAGIKIPLGFPNLFIEARYIQGLINITDDAAAENAIPRVKTNGFNILAGVEIPLSKNKSKN